MGPVTSTAGVEDEARAESRYSIGVPRRRRPVGVDRRPTRTRSRGETPARSRQEPGEMASGATMIAAPSCAKSEALPRGAPDDEAGARSAAREPATNIGADEWLRRASSSKAQCCQNRERRRRRLSANSAFPELVGFEEVSTG